MGENPSSQVVVRFDESMAEMTGGLERWLSDAAGKGIARQNNLISLDESGIDRLQHLLAEGSHEVKEVVSRIDMNSLDPGLADQFNRIRYLVERYDFDEALEVLQRL